MYWLPLILWLGLIFYFSSLPGMAKKAEPDFWLYFVRKGAHVAEYAVLASLFLRSFRFYFSKIDQRKILALAFLFSLAYALSDEVHQLFVPGREGKFLDVGFDSIGIILGIFFYQAKNLSRSAVKPKYRKRKSRKNKNRPD